MKKKVTFKEQEQEIKAFTPELDKNPDIYAITGKVVSVVDDEVEDKVELLKEVQFIIGGEDKKVIAILNKSGEVIQDQEEINKQLKMFTGSEFADLQKNILGSFAKNNQLNISQKFVFDEEIVARKEIEIIDENNNKEILPGKLLYIESNGKKLNREGQLTKVDIVQKVGKDFFEDAGEDIDTTQGRRNLDKNPIKTSLSKRDQATIAEIRGQINNITSPSTIKSNDSRLLNPKSHSRA